MEKATLHYAVERVEIVNAVDWHVGEELPSHKPQAVGHCPACGANFAEPIIESVITTAMAAPDTTTRQTRTFHCNCSHPHPNRPDDVPTGCGRFWTLTIVQANGVFTVEPGDPTMEAASRELADVAKNQVQSVRNSAEKWIGGTTALLGLLGVAGVAVGKDAISDLSPDPKIAAGILIGLAVVASAGAVWKGYAAAYGWPKQQELKDDEQLRQWYLDRTSGAAKSIRCSVTFAVAALLLLTAGVGVIWFGSTTDSFVQITYVNSKNQPETACGTLTNSTGQFLELKMSGDKSSTSMPYPFGSIKSVNTVTKC